MTWFFQDHKWKMKHGIKPQATSRKPHAPIFRNRKPQAASLKQAINETVPRNEIAEAHAQLEVASDKPQASSTKRQ